MQVTARKQVMLKISCGTVMTSKWVTKKNAQCIWKGLWYNYVLVVFNPLWVAVASLAYICTL